MEETYSFSKISCFEDCGFKFKLRYVDKIQTFASSIALDFGSLVHSVEEEIAKCIKNNEKIDYLQLKNYFMESMFEIENKFKADYWSIDKSNRTYFDKKYEYLEKGIYRLKNFCNAHESYKVVGIEDSFKIKFNDSITLNGKIDRTFYDTATDKYLLQDIKTYAVPVDQDKLVTPLQFVFYALALKNKYNCTIDQIQCQYDLPFCDITQDAGTKGFVDRGIKKLDKLFEGVHNKEFAPKPSPLCHYCEYCMHNPSATGDAKFMCPYYSHYTKENKDFNKENEWQGLENHEKVLNEHFAKHNIVLSKK